MNNWNALRKALKLYIEENWMKSYNQMSGQSEPDRQSPDASDVTKGSSYSDKDARNLQELISELGETFHEMLFRKINESGMTDSEVYKRANIDRRFFSKIRNNPAYHPGKRTVLALAVALKLDIDEAVDFLSKAGYAFSPSNKGDLIVKYFIEREMYDIQVINYALYEFGEPLLGDDRDRKV